MSRGQLDELSKLFGNAVDNHEEARDAFFRFAKTGMADHTSKLSKNAMCLGESAERIRAAKILEKAIEFWEEYGQETGKIYSSENNPYRIASLLLDNIFDAITGDKELVLLGKNDTVCVATPVPPHAICIGESAIPLREKCLKDMTVDEQVSHIIATKDNKKMWNVDLLHSALAKEFEDAELYHVRGLIKIMEGRCLIEYVGVSTTDFYLNTDGEKKDEEPANQTQEENHDFLIDSIAKLIGMTEERWSIKEIAFGLEKIYPHLPETTVERYVNMMVGRGLLEPSVSELAGSVCSTPPREYVLADGALEQLGIQEEEPAEEDQLIQTVEQLLRSNRDVIFNYLPWSINQLKYALIDRETHVSDGEIKNVIQGIKDCVRQDNGKYCIVCEEDTLMDQVYSIIISDKTRGWTQYDLLSIIRRKNLIGEHSKNGLNGKSEEEVSFAFDESLKGLLGSEKIELIPPGKPWPKENRWRYLA